MTSQEGPIALTGLPGSGKTTLARLLAPELGLAIIDVAELLRQALPEAVCDLHRANVGPAFIRHHGVSGVFEVVREALRADRKVMLDSLRLEDTCRELVRSYPTAQVWLIEVPDHVRLRRLRDRLGLDAAEANCVLAAYSEFDGELPRLRDLADVTLQNDETPADLLAAGRYAAERQR